MFRKTGLGSKTSDPLHEIQIRANVTQKGLGAQILVPFCTKCKCPRRVRGLSPPTFFVVYLLVWVLFSWVLIMFWFQYLFVDTEDETELLEIETKKLKRKKLKSEKLLPARRHTKFLWIIKKNGDFTKFLDIHKNPTKSHKL